MDTSVNTDRGRQPLLWITLAPLIPQLFGSVFNIWYNVVAIKPLLVTAVSCARLKNKADLVDLPPQGGPWS